MVKYFFLIFFAPFLNAAHPGLSYTQEKIGARQVHVLVIHPQDFNLIYAPADEKGQSLQSVPKIAERYGAAAGLNGGFFLKDGRPAGLAKRDGKWVSFSKKLRGAMGWSKGGTLFFEQLLIRSPADIQSQKKWRAAQNIIAGGPLLIAKGKPVNFENEGLREDFLEPHARSVMGVLPDGKWIWVAVDERTGWKGVMKAVMLGQKDLVLGMSLKDLQTYLLKKGCVWALNLDGGLSSTLYVEGEIKNESVGEDKYKGKFVPRVGDALLLVPKNTL